eukprot:jgi/Botrbrau1/3952/Bobra.0365s0027.1
MSSKAAGTKKTIGGGSKRGDGKKGKQQGKKDGETGTKRPGSAHHVEAAPLKKRGLFAKDLPMMMYGYGDAETPYEETVELVEDILVEYIVSLMMKATEVASGPNGKILVDDILFLLRKDTRKYARAMELLEMNEVITKAKKMEGLGEDVD